MIINPKTLSADALDGLLEAFIGRDGTDYGEVELSLQQKLQQLRPQVQSGAVVIVFDPLTEQVNLVTSQEYQAGL